MTDPLTIPETDRANQIWKNAMKYAERAHPHHIPAQYDFAENECDYSIHNIALKASKTGTEKRYWKRVLKQIKSNAVQLRKEQAKA